MKKTLLMTAAATMFAMPAMAEMHKDDHGKDHKKMEEKVKYYFEQIDENGDGNITRVENEAFAESTFAEADSDGNGEISMDEMKEYKKEEHKKMKEELGWDDKKDHKDHDDKDDMEGDDTSM